MIPLGYIVSHHNMIINTLLILARINFNNNKKKLKHCAGEVGSLIYFPTAILTKKRDETKSVNDTKLIEMCRSEACLQAVIH